MPSFSLIKNIILIVLNSTTKDKLWIMRIFIDTLLKIYMNMMMDIFNNPCWPPAKDSSSYLTNFNSLCIFYITPYGVTLLIYICNYLFGFILNFPVYMYACKLMQRNKSNPWNLENKNHTDIDLVFAWWLKCNKRFFYT